VWRPEPHLYPRSANVPPALEMCLVVVVVQRTALLSYLCLATKLLRAGFVQDESVFGTERRRTQVSPALVATIDPFAALDAFTSMGSALSHALKERSWL
jgi:hypothetical protein